MQMNSKSVLESFWHLPMPHVYFNYSIFSKVILLNLPNLQVRRCGTDRLFYLASSTIDWPISYFQVCGSRALNWGHRRKLTSNCSGIRAAISEEQLDHLDFAFDFVRTPIYLEIYRNVRFLFTVLFYRLHELAERPLRVVSARVPERFLCQLLSF